MQVAKGWREWFSQGYLGNKCEANIRIQNFWLPCWARAFQICIAHFTWYQVGKNRKWTWIMHLRCTRDRKTAPHTAMSVFLLVLIFIRLSTIWIFLLCGVTSNHIVFYCSCKHLCLSNHRTTRRRKYILKKLNLWIF